MWSAVLPLSQLIDWDVRTVHLPGHHKDYELPDHYSISSFADHILSQIHFTIHDTILLIGHSMGGYIAADIAARYPNQTHGLVLFHSKVSNDDEAKKIDRARAIELSQSNTLLYISTMLRNTFSPNNVSRLKAEIEAMIQSAQLRISHECIKACHTAMMNREDRSAAIDTARIKRYYFLGSDDNSIPYPSLQSELQKVPEKNIWLEHSCGHMGHIEAPESSRRFFELLKDLA